MIKEIKINNFQSHKQTTIKFSDKVNIIIGSSNSGKSAILRALYWIVENSPSGLSFVNHTQLKNGNLEGEVKVEIITHKGKIVRLKNKNKNAYIVKDNELLAIGQSVPEEVTKFFNFDVVNLQKQLDKPFLLSETAGTINKFFNKILNLELIDVILKRIESDKRSIKNKFNFTNDEIDKINKQLENLDWLDKFEEYITKLENIENKIKKYNDLINKLEELEYTLIQINKKLEKYNNLNLIDEKLKKLMDVENLIYDNEKKLIDFLNIFDILISINEKLKKFKDLKLIEEKINQFKNLQNKFQKIQNDYLNLSNILSESQKINQKLLKIDINSLIKKLPKICPLCGNPFNIKEEV